MLCCWLLLQEDEAGNSIIDDNPELRHIDLLKEVKAEKEQSSSPVYKHIGHKVCELLSISKKS